MEYHEPIDDLSQETRELHRALSSLIEELEAIAWYQQRMDATHDAELKAILEHNRDEEVEHAAMALEWIRRRYPVFDRELRDNLFTSGEIASHGHGGADEGADGSLGVGSAKE